MLGQRTVCRAALMGLSHCRQSSDRLFRVMVPELELFAGDVALLTGENGSGKSSILEMLGLVSRPERSTAFRLPGADSSDDELVEVMPLYEMDRQETLAAIRARRIGFVVQTGALVPFLTVRENVALPQSYSLLSKTADVDALLEALDLASLAAAYPAQLSIGQRQRTAIARAVSNQPQIILADEPTAALDPEYKSKAVELLISVAQDIDAAVLIATHEAPEIAHSRLRRLHLTVSSETVGEAQHVTSVLSEAPT